MIVTMFGSGILYMPCAFLSVGWLQGIFIFAFVVFYTGLTMFFLCDSCIELKQDNQTFYSVCTAAYPILGPIADFLVALVGIFGSLAYIIIISNTLSSAFNIKEHRMYVVIAIGVTVFLISFPKNLSALTWASYLSISSVIFLSVFVLYLFIINHSNIPSSDIKYFNKDYTNGISLLLFAVGCQQAMINVHSKLKDKSVANSLKLILIACIFGPLLYLAVGLFGYFAIGKESGESVIEIVTKQTNIRQALLAKNSKNKYLIYFIVIMYSVTLLCSCAFQLNPSKISIGSLITKISGASEDRFSTSLFHFILTFIIISVNTFVSINLTDPGFVVSLVGAICSNGICYIIPSITFHAITKNFESLKPAALSVVMIGTVNLIFSTFKIIYDKIQSN